MTNIRNHKLQLTVLASSMAMAAAVLPLQAHAQASSPNAASTTALPQGDAVRAFSIPAGPLDVALDRFARTAGVNLSYDAALVAGSSTQGVQGSMGTAAGLRRLLEGTGLEALAQPGGGYSLRRAVAAPASTPVTSSTLPQVTVTEQADPGNLTEGTGSFTTAGPVNAATGLNLRLRETPQSVTVVTSERIEQQGLSSLAEVAEQVPGVTYAGSGTPIGGRTEIFARGFNIDTYQIDGINVPWEALGESERYGQSALDTAIYDSITVVRGATGLLTGAGDPSATISLTRKKPTQTFQGSVSGSLGSWDRRRGVVDVGGPLNAAGTLRGRVVGAHEEGKTWVDNYKNDRTIFYGMLEADLSSQSLLSVALEHARDGSTGAPWASAYGIPLLNTAGALIPAGRNTTAAPHWAFSDTDRTTLTTSLKHRFNADWNASFAYIYSKFNSQMRRGMVNSIPASGAASTVRVLDLDMHNDVHAIDAKVEGKYNLFGRRHDVVAGFNASDSRQVYGRSVYTVIPGAAQWNGSELVYTDLDWANLPDDLPSDAFVRQQGIYAATRLRPIDGVAVIAGGRLSAWKTRSADAFAPYAIWDDRSYSSEFTPYVGVVVDITRSLSAYASYTQIFNPQSNRDVAGNLLDPEEGKNHEIGIKGEWLNGRLNASAAFFETRKDNLAVRDGTNFTPTGDPAYRAESNTKGRGWEFEVAGQIAPNWQMQAGYSRFAIQDFAGARLNTSRPVHEFKLYTSYRPSALPRLTVGGGVRWQGSTYGEGSTGALREAYTIQDYAVFNLNARYALSDQLTLSVALNNVFDKSYRISYYDHSYGAPRNLMATLKYSF